MVIVQTDEDGKGYVCAYASAGLTSAQRNYHIVHLELLAFVFARGKFYDWLAGISFVWRSDCRAHEFLHKARLSTNPTIARYSLTLAEFDFTVEWFPEVQMIADSFSRMTLVASEGSGKALSLPEIVFEKTVGERLRKAKAEVKSEVSLLMFEPVARVVLVEPCLVEFENDGGTEWYSAEILGKAEVPVMTNP